MNTPGSGARVPPRVPARRQLEHEHGQLAQERVLQPDPEQRSVEHELEQRVPLLRRPRTEWSDRTRWAGARDAHGRAGSARQGGSHAPRTPAAARHAAKA